MTPRKCGQDACRQGKTLSQNPFPLFSHEWRSWRYGYMSEVWEHAEE